MDGLWTWLLLCAFCLFCWLVCQKLLKRYYHPIPPGPSGIRAFSEILAALRSQRVHLAAEKWVHQYGDIFSVNAAGTTMVFLNTSDLVREVFNSSQYKAVTNDRPKTFFGKYVANNYGNITEYLTYDSTLLYFRRMFHNSLKLYGDGVHDFEQLVVQELEGVAERLENSDKDIDMGTTLSDSLLRIIHILIMDKSADTNSSIIDDMRNYNLWGNRLNGFDVQTVLATLPILRYLPMKHGRIWQNAVKYRDAVSKVFVRDRIMNILDEQKSGVNDGRGGVVSVLLDAQRQQRQSDTDSYLTDDQISAIALDMSAAAYLTSKGALVGIFLVCVHYPHIQKKIYEEITAEIGSRTPSIDDRGNLPYTEATILELLRYLSHAVLGVPHRCREDIQVRGYTIPKGAMVVSNLWYIHHDVKVWGDPWTFRPERFLNDDGMLISADHPLRKNLLPFGTGRRQCPGETLARSRIFIYVTYLLQRLVFLPPKDGVLTPLEPSLWTPGVIIQPPTFTCRVIPRNSK